MRLMRYRSLYGLLVDMLGDPEFGGSRRTIHQLDQRDKVATNGRDHDWTFDSHNLKTAWTGSRHVFSKFGLAPYGKENLSDQCMSDVNRCPCPVC
jgi:hypothetical protein